MPENKVPKQIPDRADDAKVGSTEMVYDLMDLCGDLDLSSRNADIWMLYGTPRV